MKKEKQFDLWLKVCKENRTELYRLEGTDNNGFYKTTRRYLGPDRNYYFDTPVFIGWVNDRIVVASEDYRSALSIWKSRS